MTENVPAVLKQKFLEVESNSKDLSLSIFQGTGFESGRFLFWRGEETKYFWIAGSPQGSFSVHEYKLGASDATLCLEYNFGRTAVVADAVYFPLENCPGVLVAVSDRSMGNYGDFLAYFSLKSRRFVRSVYVSYPITKILSILDGTAKKEDFQRLNKSFHTGWPHILLVGTRFGGVCLLHLDMAAETDNEQQNETNQLTHKNPFKARKVVHLSKIYVDDEMFVFRSDDGITKCNPKERVYVSALYWIEKSGLAIVGFNFGGIMVISLRTSKVYSLLYVDGLVEHFALQEPEEDPRPILFLWVSVRPPNRGSIAFLLTINFPKDEESKDPESYTYLDPTFAPSMKWSPDFCSRMISMRTILRNEASLSKSGVGPLASSSTDSSLLLFCWSEKSSTPKIHGALFDLNSFYAKRLIGRMQPDNTIARQLPFFARFSSTENFSVSPSTVFDIAVENVYRFAPPAFLNDSIDQLYYPSTFNLSTVCLSSTKIFKAKVKSIQEQLIFDLAKNVVTYFNSPEEPCKWIHSIGLANSAPANNINEQRACLLRVLLYNHFPAILTLIEAVAEIQDSLKYIHRWIWKEVEVTKTKVDEFCSPLFEVPSLDLSPSARCFVVNSKRFFRRASIIFQKLAEINESRYNGQEWTKSLSVQHKTSRHVCLYSSLISFALNNGLLPENPHNFIVYANTEKKFKTFHQKTLHSGKSLKIHSLIQEIMQFNSEDPVWHQKTANEWYPPSSIASFLPILLFVNVTEISKLTLIGYYCLDLEQALSSIRKDDEEILQLANNKYFDKCLSYLMQDEFSLDVLNKIKNFWFTDRQMTNEIELLTASEQTERTSIGENKIEEELKWLPLNTPAEIKNCQEEYLKLKWGPYKYNLNILDKRRYQLLLELPPLKGDEPEFVSRCHAECLEIRKKFPSFFGKIDCLPQPIVDKYLENRARLSAENSLNVSINALTKSHLEEQPVFKLDIRRQNKSLLTSSLSLLKNDQQQGRRSLKRTFSYFESTQLDMMGNKEREMIREVSFLPEDLGEQSDQQFQLSFATPRKRQRLTLFDEEAENMVDSSGLRTPKSKHFQHRLSGNIGIPEPFDVDPTAFKDKIPVECKVIDKSAIREKDWEKINKVTQTPVSLRRTLNRASRIPVATQRKSELQKIPPTGDARILLEEPQQSIFAANNSPIIQAANPADETHYETVFDEAVLKTPERVAPLRPAPTSILKSDKKRLPSEASGRKSRLRFAPSLFTYESIPSRVEKAMDERHDTSFSSFAQFSSSGSSASALLSSISMSTAESQRTTTPIAEVVESNGNNEGDNHAGSETEQTCGGVPIIHFDDLPATTLVNQETQEDEEPMDSSEPSPEPQLESEEQNEETTSGNIETVKEVVQETTTPQLAFEPAKVLDTEHKDQTEQAPTNLASEEVVGGQNSNTLEPMLSNKIEEQQPTIDEEEKVLPTGEGLKTKKTPKSPIAGKKKTSKEIEAAGLSTPVAGLSSVATEWINKNLRRSTRKASIGASEAIHKLSQRVPSRQSTPTKGGNISRSPSRTPSRATPSPPPVAPPMTPPPMRTRGRSETPQKKKDK